MLGSHTVLIFKNCCQHLKVIHFTIKFRSLSFPEKLEAQVTRGCSLTALIYWKWSPLQMNLEVPHHSLQPDSFYAWPWWTFEFATPALTAPCPEFTSHTFPLPSQATSFPDLVLCSWIAIPSSACTCYLHRFSWSWGFAGFYLSLCPDCNNSLRVDLVSSTVPHS